MPFSADAVQAVCFIEPGSRPNDAMATWQTIFGDTPNGFQRVANSPALQSSANGEHDGFFCTLNVQVGRLDFIVAKQNPQATMLAANETPPRIEDIPKATAFLGEHLKQIARLHKTTRVGIVLDLTSEIPGGDESTAMHEHLARLALPPGATDLQFQINVRKQFLCRPEVAMNRICFWSIGRAGLLQLTPAGPISSGMRPILGLRIDVNTAPETQVPAASSDSIISELADEAARLHMTGLDGLWGDGKLPN